MGFTVADVRAAVTDLKKRGVVFEEYDTPGLRTIDAPQLNRGAAI